MSKLWSWLIPEGSTQLSRRAFLALAFITLAVHLPGQIGLPAMDRDEARYAQATKQMLASGDFIDIKFADQSRYLQPIGIYWLQAAAALPFGGAQAPIFAFRLPSLLSALASVLLTAWFGARLFGPVVGMSAGLILAPSLLLTGEAHFAKIDSALSLATLIAQTALFLTIAREEEAPRRFIGWPLIFWIAIGVGGLLKGPIILLVVGLTIIAYGLWQREWRFLKDLNPSLGVLIVAAIVAPWLILISMKTHGAFLQHAVGHSFGYKIAHGEQSHGQPPGYHTALFMLTFFPGVVLAGLGGFHAWRHRGDRACSLPIVLDHPDLGHVRAGGDQAAALCAAGVSGACAPGEPRPQGCSGASGARRRPLVAQACWDFCFSSPAQRLPLCRSSQRASFTSR